MQSTVASISKMTYCIYTDFMYMDSNHDHNSSPHLYIIRNLLSNTNKILSKSVVNGESTPRRRK